MVRLQPSLPTLSETRALVFLIEHGPSTVRDYFEQGEHINGRAYTTIMSLMDILHAKKLATRRAEGRAYRYKASVTLQELRGEAIQYVIDNFFDGSLREFQKAAKFLKKSKSTRKIASPKRVKP
jgi:BlaI family transcriptional regulator, penicillinase repressor